MRMMTSMRMMIRVRGVMLKRMRRRKMRMLMMRMQPTEPGWLLVDPSAQCAASGNSPAT